MMSPCLHRVSFMCEQEIYPFMSHTGRSMAQGRHQTYCKHNGSRADRLPVSAASLTAVPTITSFTTARARRREARATARKAASGPLFPTQGSLLAGFLCRRQLRRPAAAGPWVPGFGALVRGSGVPVFRSVISGRGCRGARADVRITGVSDPRGGGGE